MYPSRAANAYPPGPRVRVTDTSPPPGSAGHAVPKDGDRPVRPRRPRWPRARVRPPCREQGCDTSPAPRRTRYAVRAASLSPSKKLSADQAYIASAALVSGPTLASGRESNECDHSDLHTQKFTMRGINGYSVGIYEPAFSSYRGKSVGPDDIGYSQETAE